MPWRNCNFHGGEMGIYDKIILPFYRNIFLQETDQEIAGGKLKSINKYL